MTLSRIEAPNKCYTGATICNCPFCVLKDDVHYGEKLELLTTKVLENWEKHSIIDLYMICDDVKEIDNELIYNPYNVHQLMLVSGEEEAFTEEEIGQLSKGLADLSLLTRAKSDLGYRLKQKHSMLTKPIYISPECKKCMREDAMIGLVRGYIVKKRVFMEEISNHDYLCETYQNTQFRQLIPYYFGCAKWGPSYASYMEYTPGNTLADYIINKVDFDVTGLLIVIHAFLDDAYTRCGFVHCDLHARNIILCETETNFVIEGVEINLPFRPVLIDFEFSRTNKACFPSCVSGPIMGQLGDILSLYKMFTGFDSPRPSVLIKVLSDIIRLFGSIKVAPHYPPLALQHTKINHSAFLMRYLASRSI